jgi:hypothetical protein
MATMTATDQEMALRLEVTDTVADLSTESLMEWVAEQTWSDFAKSVSGYYKSKGYITEKQDASLRRFMVTMKLKEAVKAAAAATAAEPTIETFDKDGGIQVKVTHTMTFAEKLAKFADVVEGYYAVPNLAGTNDLDFYWVQRPATGKWAGRVFVKRIIGGHSAGRVAIAQTLDVLAQIQASGITEAAIRYAKELGRCAACGIHLTDEISRAYGIGPICRNGKGKKAYAIAGVLLEHYQNEGETVGW